MNPVLVACSHGTSDPGGQETIRRLVAAVRRAVPAFEVRAAVVDVEPHRLPQVLADLDRPAVVVPLLLSAGFHVHHDIAEAVAARPGLVAADPLGPDWELAEIGVRRLREAGARPSDVVVLGASGSSDERALAATETAARRLGSLWGGRVEVGHVGRSGRPLCDVVEAARHGAGASGRRVVVSSYLLAPGHFQRELDRAGADLVTSPILSPSPEPGLVDLVLRRFESAAHLVPWAPPTTIRRQ